MKKLKLFFALFAMLALGVGNAWGEEVEMSSFSAKAAEMDNYISYTTAKGGGTSDPAVNSSQIRLYQGSPGGNITISAKEGVTITEVTIGSAMKTEIKWEIDGTKDANNTSLSANGKATKSGISTKSITCHCYGSDKNSRLYVNYLKVVYTIGGGETPGEGGGEDPTPEPGTGGEETWTLVTNASDLKVGDKVVIAAAGSNYALGKTQNTNNRDAVVVTKGTNTITIGDDVQIITLETGNVANTFAFNTGSAGYLYAASSTANNLKTKTILDNNGSWAISITSAGVATIQAKGTNTRNLLKKNSSSALFSCYGSGQSDVAIYKKVTSTDEPSTPTPSVSVAPTSHTFATTNVGETATQVFEITAKNTTETLSAEISNTTDYAISAIADNKITVTYQPQTADTHSAILTVKAGEEATATVNLTGKAVQALEGTWILVTDASSLKAGDEIIIAAKESDYALSTTQNDNNRGQVEVTKTDNTITATTEAQVLTLQTGNVENTLALYTGAGYLCAASSGSNYLRTETTLSDNSSWTIAIADGVATLTAQGDYTRNIMQYNSTSKLFACYGTASQKALSLYKKVDASEVLAPNFSLEEGSYYGAQSVEITCATADASIYYTTDGTTPSSTSTKYTGAVAISETKTLKAIAIKGEYSSSVTEATYTILAPLSTMQEIFDKATDATQSVHIKFNDWVISGVVPGKDGKPSSNAYITDGSKGFIIYNKDGHGFNVGNKLSGTVVCDLTRYYGSAEVVGLTSSTEGLTVTTDGDVTPVEVADKSTLSGVNTGAVIQITGVCETKTINDKLYYYVADVQLYNSLYSYTDLTVGNKYNVTGVYLQYNEIPEILPRSAADIEEIIDIPTATISIENITMEVGEEKTIEATVTPDAAKTKVQYAITAGSEYVTLNGATITGVKEGTATITATIAEAVGEYYGTTKDFTVTVTPKSTKDNVVVLAKCGEQWYAMMAQYVTGKNSHLAALKVDYVGGKLYNVSDENKALIEWTRAVVDGKAAFYNDGKYLTGKFDETDLTLATTACEWAIDGSSYLQGDRTFFYNAENNWFRNFKTSNAEKTNYSALPVVTAPVYTEGTLYTIKATAENGTVVGAGVYVAGDKVTLTADPAMDYTFVSWTKGGEVVSTANPFVFEATENLDLVANFQEITATTKTLTGKFSTGEYEYAEFATGNLQYKKEGENETWRFAKQQYQYVGEANINVGDENYKGWIDMLGWSNGDANNFGVNPSCDKDLYVGDFVDWGTKMGEGWETLSHEQWDYLLNKRGAGKKQIARVGTVFGVLLFPDEWEMPSGISVTAVYDNDFKVNIYNYTLDQWAALENAGALFLPAAGRRFGGYGNTYGVDGLTDKGEEYKLQYCTNDLAAYWTSTKHNDGERVSYLLNLGSGGTKYSTLELGWYEYGHVGQSVRLAKVTDITPVVIREGLTDGQWGTLCPDQEVTDMQGASFYTLTYLEMKDEMPYKLFFDEITTDYLEAGKPYLFIAEGEEIKGVKSGGVVSTASNYNGFCGNVSRNTITIVTTHTGYVADGDVVNYYGIINSRFTLLGNGTTAPHERAYVQIKNGQLNCPNPPASLPALAPGARRVVAGATGTNVATGMENIDASAQPMKMIIDGQLYILRGEKMYDAQGKLVK